MLSTATQNNALQTVRSGVPYWELPAPAEEFVTDGVGVTRRLACYWKDRQRFLKDLLGGARIVGTPGRYGAKLRRDLPELHPDYDVNSGRFLMWATGAQLVQGYGWPGRGPGGIGVGGPPAGRGPLNFNDSGFTGADGTRSEDGKGFAVYDVRYAPTLYKVLSDEEADRSPQGELCRWTVIDTEPAASVLPVPKGMLEWDDLFTSHGRVKAPRDLMAPFLFPNPIISVQWLQVPEQCWRDDSIFGFTDYLGTYQQGAVGSVNDRRFLDSPLSTTPGQVNLGTFQPGNNFQGYAAETLLCLAPRRRKYLHANGDTYLDITFLFEYRPMTHNKFLREDGGFHRLIRSYDPSQGPFLEWNMARLFDPAQP